MPLSTDGAGITKPGFTAWLQRAPGAGQFRIWLGSPYHGLVPAGTYGLGSRHSRGVAARLPGTSVHGILRDPRTLLAGVSIGILQYVPAGNGAMLVSAGDRHSDAGRKPLKHGGGLFIDRLKSKSSAPVAVPVCSIAPICGKTTNSCSAPAW